VAKVQQPLKNLRIRAELLRATPQEDDDGQITYTYAVLGTVWCAVERVEKTPYENMAKQSVTAGCKVIRFYKIIMRRYFSRDARHAYINALRFKGKVLPILAPFEQDGEGIFYQAIAADLGRRDSND
jgi:hypothetical protein